MDTSMTDVAIFCFNTKEATAIYEDSQLVFDYDVDINTALGIYKFQGANITVYRCKPGNDDNIYFTYLDMESNGWPKVIDIIPLDNFIALDFL